MDGFELPARLQSFCQKLGIAPPVRGEDWTPPSRVGSVRAWELAPVHPASLMMFKKSDESGSSIDVQKVGRIFIDVRGCIDVQLKEGETGFEIPA